MPVKEIYSQNWNLFLISINSRQQQARKREDEDRKWVFLTRLRCDGEHREKDELHRGLVLSDSGIITGSSERASVTSVRPLAFLSLLFLDLCPNLLSAQKNMCDIQPCPCDKRWDRLRWSQWTEEERPRVRSQRFKKRVNTHWLTLTFTVIHTHVDVK